MTIAALTTAGLAKRFGQRWALTPLDLKVLTGERLIVLGPNGAGKSTLLRLLAGLTRATKGQFHVGPANTKGRQDRAKSRARVGLVAHQSFLYPTLSARENLVFACRLYGVQSSTKRVAELLSAFDLQRVSERHVGTLSQGMVRRLAVARSIIHDPELLLLDEPFSGLDATAAKHLEDLLEAVNARRRTLILVSHDFVRAARLGTRYLVLHQGLNQLLELPTPTDSHTLIEAYQDAVDALSRLPA